MPALCRPSTSCQTDKLRRGWPGLRPPKGAWLRPSSGNASARRRDKRGHYSHSIRFQNVLAVDGDLLAARARHADHDVVLTFMIGKDQITVIHFACEHFGAAGAASACFARARYLEAVLAQDLENRLRGRNIEHRARARKLDLEGFVVGLVGLSFAERLEMHGGRRPVIGHRAHCLHERSWAAAVKVLAIFALGEDRAQVERARRVALIIVDRDGILEFRRAELLAERRRLW